MNKSIFVGLNKGKARVWLEGDWLAAAGFLRGTRYEVGHQEGMLVLRVTITGNRKVSGKGSRPIIDMNSDKLAPFIGNCVAFVTVGCIIIRKAA